MFTHWCDPFQFTCTWNYYGHIVIDHKHETQLNYSRRGTPSCFRNENWLSCVLTKRRWHYTQQTVDISDSAHLYDRFYLKFYYQSRVVRGFANISGFDSDAVIRYRMCVGCVWMSDWIASIFDCVPLSDTACCGRVLCHVTSLFARRYNMLLRTSLSYTALRRMVW